MNYNDQHTVTTNSGPAVSLMLRYFYLQCF